MNNKKIAFFKTGSFSHTNDSLHTVLKIQFSEYEIVVIDIYENKVVKLKSLQNIYHAWSEYGFKIFKSKKHLIKSLVNNSYMFNLVKDNINKLYSDKDFTFSFQSQSLYDMSIQGIPNYLYTDHTFLVNETYPEFKKHLLYSEESIERERSIYNNATINFTMSQHVTNSIINDYGCLKDKVKCVYAGSNTPKTMENNNDKYFSKNILFVGMNWERKGGPLLVKAFKNVLKTHKDATLTIVGTSPNIDIPNCNIVGKVKLEEVQRYYQEASIFCMPTTIEPFGMVFVEAMGNYLPIVATNIGALPDFVENGKNGFLIEYNDSNSLTNYLNLLLESSQKCKDFGYSSMQVVESKYKWSLVGEKIKKSILESTNV